MYSMEAAVGGIVGYAAADAQLLYCLHNSYSRANVTFTNIVNEDSGYVNIGGIAGALHDSAINNYYVPPAGGGVTVNDPYDEANHNIGELFGYVDTNQEHIVSRNYFMGDTQYEAMGYGHDVPEDAFIEITDAGELLAALNAGRDAVAVNIYDEYGVEGAMSIVYEWFINEGGNGGWPVHSVSEAPPQPTTYAFARSAGTGGTVSGMANGNYQQGVAVSVTAAAANGYRFTGWTAIGVTLANTTANPAAFVMPANAVTLTANFEAVAPDYDYSYSVPAATPVPTPDDEEIIDEEVPLAEPDDIWSNPFIDVDEDDWFYDDVRYTHLRGLMLGTAGDKYSPNSALTRGMAVTALYRASDRPDTGGLRNPFYDVADGKYYTDAVKWAAANNIVVGIGAGAFAPESPITRQDLAVLLNRYADYMGLTLPEAQPYTAPLDDADIADYAKESIEKFFKAMVVEFNSDGLMAPKTPATRAEATAMLHRFMEAAGDNG
jgi:uncharacterized repeat protein (TIGR02543 family)